MIKRLIYIFLPITFILYLLTGCESLNDEVEVEESNVGLKLSNIEDFEYLFTILESNYPYFEMNKRMNGNDWIANKDNYIKRIEEAEGDLGFYLVMKSIIKDLNYRHAQVLNDKAYTSLYNTYRDVEAIPWLEVLEDPVVQSRYYELVQDDDENMLTEAYITPNNIVLEKWAESSTAYIKIKSFNHFNIEIDWAELKPFLDEIDDCHSLIIDIRGNGGGDSHYWSDYLVPELISETEKFMQYFCFRGGEYSESFIDFA